MLSVKLTYVSPPSLSSTLLLLCLLPRFLLSSLLSLCFARSLFFTLSLSPSLSLSNPFHTDAPSRPAWQEWWDVSNRYNAYPNILHCEQGGWVGGGVAGCWEKYLFRKEVKWRSGTWYSHDNKYSNLFLKLKNGLFFCVIASLEIKHL